MEWVLAYIFLPILLQLVSGRVTVPETPRRGTVDHNIPKNAQVTAGLASLG